jgi:solute carrier family 25 protein 42
MSFATFETLKSHVHTARGLAPEQLLDAPTRLVCGGIAGLVAQSATYPLDIVRRRLQVHGSATGVARGSTWAMLKHIFQSEGLAAGLYKGLSMNWIKGPIAVAVSFTVNDMLKQRFLDARLAGNNHGQWR